MPGSGLNPLTRLAGLDEEAVNAIVETSGAGRVFTQGMDRARGQSGLFEQFAAAGLGRAFAGIDQARRQLPGEGFERGPVLPHDRNLAAAGERDDRDVIGLLDGVIDLAAVSPRENSTSRAMMLIHGDTVVVRRERMRGHFMADRGPHVPRSFRATVSGGRRRKVVAKA